LENHSKNEILKEIGEHYANEYIMEFNLTGGINKTIKFHYVLKFK